jgi:hypothetical protein
MESMGDAMGGKFGCPSKLGNHEMTAIREMAKKLEYGRRL